MEREGRNYKGRTELKILEIVNRDEVMSQDQLTLDFVEKDQGGLIGIEESRPEINEEQLSKNWQTSKVNDGQQSRADNQNQQKNVSRGSQEQAEPISMLHLLEMQLMLQRQMETVQRAMQIGGLVPEKNPKGQGTQGWTMEQELVTESKDPQRTLKRDEDKMDE